MKKGILLWPAVCLIALYVLGSSIVMGLSMNSNQDAWIAVLISIAASMPIVYLFARLMNRYPGRDLFDICIEAFGNVIGKLAIVLFTVYGVYLGALVFRNFSEFLQVTVFEKMPQTISLLMFAVLVIWSARRGPETLGHWSFYALPVVLAAMVITVLLLIKNMNPSNLLPIGENLSGVPSDVYNNFIFPFTETMALLGVLNALQPGVKPGKVWALGILLGGGLMIIVYFRNAMTLGFPMETTEIFPSFSSASIITAGLFSRVESLIGSNLLLCGLVKSAVILIFAAKGTAKLCNAEDYRPFVAPLGLVTIALSSILFKNTMEMFDFLPMSNIFVFPIQIMLPITLLIAAEIRQGIKNRRENKAA